ncbi:MAG: symmetrical bis(5'-nucleosyl)-tetraphosphatase [Gammaproteobacteria bacterium]|nr:symmetrical bis(5'-nucleosyl)-tetraphosphatase [Gammaproteobacteria bacterium]MDH3767043.1 symmetrical bis(5'-nucleosyl)-tetraphosphatase [Gammaproteobacteria bacterium]
MTVYGIGDVQGCHAALEQLIDKLNFDRRADRLWFTGDLVNRGPDSLQTLRFVKGLGNSAVTVLGNHDLHLLAVDAGVATAKKRDTLTAILDAPDRIELIDWLRRRPLAFREGGFLLVHAGLPPRWDANMAMRCAAEVEAVLRSNRYHEFLRNMYGDAPATWYDHLTGDNRLRCIVNSLTRMRYCSPDGEMCLKSKGAPGTQPAGFHPWFRIPGRASARQKIIFGHWSTLGETGDPDVCALDTGCVWGGKLSALSLDAPSGRISVSCQPYQSVSAGKSPLP